MKSRIIYIHSGSWPSSSPSVVFVTGAVAGMAFSTPTMLITRNGSRKPSEEIFRSIAGYDMPQDLRIMRAEGAGQGNRKFYNASAARAALHIRNGAARVIITRNIGFLPYLLYLKIRYNVKCYFECHDFYGDLGLRKDLPSSTLIFKKHLFEKTILPRLDGVICLTEVQRAMFRKYYPKTNIIVAPTGLFQVCRPSLKRKNEFCYIGSTDPHKGVGTVLKAMKKMKNINSRLVVIGGKTPQAKEKFFNLVSYHGLDRRVGMSGWLPRSEVCPIMDKCIGSIVPLNDTPFNRYFTSPLKILDSFSRGLPVIASDLPSVREFVEEGRQGLFFRPGDHENLATLMDDYVQNDFYSLLSPEVETKALNYLWEKRGEKLVNRLL